MAKTSSRGCANSTCGSDAGSSNGSRLGKQSQPLGAGLKALCLGGTHSLTHRFVRPLLVEEVNVALLSDGARDSCPMIFARTVEEAPRSIIREAKACRKQALFSGKYVGGEDLRWGGEKFVRLGHQCRRDLAVDVRLARVFVAEGIEDPERGRRRPCRVPIDGARLGFGER